MFIDLKRNSNKSLTDKKLYLSRKFTKICSSKHLVLSLSLVTVKQRFLVVICTLWWLIMKKWSLNVKRNCWDGAVSHKELIFHRHQFCTKLLLHGCYYCQSVFFCTVDFILLGFVWTNAVKSWIRVQNWRLCKSEPNTSTKHHQWCKVM